MSRKVKQVQRTCKAPQCGNVWYVPFDQRKLKASTKYDRFMAGAADISGGGSLSGTWGLGRVGLTERDKLALSLNRCGACGSSSYKEETVKF